MIAMEHHYRASLVTLWPEGVWDLRVYDAPCIVEDYSQFADRWLHDEEFAFWKSCRHSRRKQSFFCGRIAIKKMLLRHPALRGFTPRQLLVVSSILRPQAVRPYLELKGQRWEGELAISHTDNFVGVAVGEGSHRIGIDVVETRQWSSTAPHPFLHDSEQLLVPSGEWWRLWGIKEAAFKAAGKDSAFRPLAWKITSLEPGKASWESESLGLRGDAVYWQGNKNIVSIVSILADECNHD
jgi:phosphopantetheinyl transferase